MSAKRISRKIFAIGGASALVVVALAAWLVLDRDDGVGVESRVPAEAGAVARIEAPFYCQADPRWATHTIGGSSETIRKVGCTLCCLSMALHLRGFDADPASLNTSLKKHSGYTSRGWLVWDAVPAVTGGRFGVVVDNSPTHGAIDAQLRRGNPVIAKVPSTKKKGASHWVLIVGKDGTEYVIHDPGTSRGRFRPLGARGARIGGIRHVKALR